MRKILEQILYIGFGIQICLGLLWMVPNMIGSPFRGESLFGVNPGWGMAFFLRLLQVAFASYVAYRFLKKLGVADRRKCVFGMLIMVTFPMTMQCHMSFGGYSLMSSLELLQFCLILDLWRSKKTKDKRKKAKVGLFCLLSLLLVAVGVPIEKKELGTDAQSSIHSVLVSRLAWSSLNETYPAWPQEWQEALPVWKVRDVSSYGDHINRVLLPYMEEVYGTDEAGSKQIQNILQQMAILALQRNTKGIVREICWDAVGYGISPVVLQLQLAGKGYDSCSGVNYANMLERTPGLSALYMTYGCRWFGLALVLTVLLCLQEKKKIRFPICFSVIYSLVLIALYTLRGAGLMDYRKTIVVVMLWLAWMIHVLMDASCFNENEKESESL